MLYVMTSRLDNHDLTKRLIAKGNGVHDLSAQIDLQYNLEELADQFLLLAAYMNYSGADVMGVKVDAKQALLLELEFTDLELNAAKLPLSLEHRQLLIGYIANHNEAYDFMRRHQNLHEAFIKLFRSYHSVTRQNPDTDDDFDDLIERLRVFAESYVLNSKYYETALSEIVRPLGKNING